MSVYNTLKNFLFRESNSESSTKFKDGPELKEIAQTIRASDIVYYKYTNYLPSVDQALARRGYILYTRDMMADDQVKACVLIKKLGVTVGGYTIETAVGESEEGYEEAKKRADFISYVINQMTGSVEKLLMNISNAIVPGFSVNEIIFKIFDDGPYKGKIGIDKIKPKPAETFTFNMDEYANVKNLIQDIDGIKTDIDVRKVLLYTYDPQNTGLPFGVSDLRAAYKHWWSKDALMRYRNMAAEKYSCPTLKGVYPSHFSEEMQNNLLKALKSYSVNSAFIIPEGSEIELMEAKGSVVMPYDSSIDSSNRGIARAIFGQILATDEGKTTGSYAQAKIHRGILGMFLSGLRKEIAEEVITEQLFKRLIEYNFGDTELIPRMILAAPDEKDIDEYGTLIKNYLDTGVIDKNEQFVRTMFGFPTKPQELIERDNEINKAVLTNTENNEGINKNTNPGTSKVQPSGEKDA